MMTLIRAIKVMIFIAFLDSCTKLYVSCNTMTAKESATETTKTATTSSSSETIASSSEQSIVKRNLIRILDEENENNNSNMNDTDEETEKEINDNNIHEDNDKENTCNIKTNCIPGSHNVMPSSSFDDDMTILETIITTPETFTVTIRTSANIQNDIIINIIRSWSPIGVDRFYQLINDNYYNCAAFFRVVPEFVIQFGIASEPNETNKWDEIPIKDDPIGIQSNTIGTISFATGGPDTRTTQLFININDNSRLDSLGFTPFGTVIQGMDILEQLIYNPTPGDSNGIDQHSYTTLGNDWILKEYPNVDIILNTSLTVESE